MSGSELDAYARILTTVGFPTATAVFLIWWVTNRLNGKLDRLIDRLEDLPDRIAEKIEYVMAKSRHAD